MNNTVIITSRTGKWKKIVSITDSLFHPIVGVLMDEGLETPEKVVLGEGASEVIEEEWESLQLLLTHHSDVFVPLHEVSRILILLNVPDAFYTRIYVDSMTNQSERMRHYERLGAKSIGIDHSILNDLYRLSTSIAQRGIIHNAMCALKMNNKSVFESVIWEDILERTDEGQLTKIARVMLGKGDLYSVSYLMDEGTVLELLESTSLYSTILNNYKEGDYHLLGLDRLFRDRRERELTDRYDLSVDLSQLPPYIHRVIIEEEWNLDRTLMESIDGIINRLNKLDCRTLPMITTALREYVEDEEEYGSETCYLLDRIDEHLSQ